MSQFKVFQKKTASSLSWLESKRLERYPQDMSEEGKRLCSFKDWPFRENCACTPEKMAEAGFYHCPTDQEPDLVRCYVCLKELDGWNPEDDPWKEHARNKDCDFVKLNKKFKEMTVKEFLKLEVSRHVNEIKKVALHNEEQIDVFDQRVNQKLENYQANY